MTTQPTHNGKPCRKCGGTLRLVKGNQCVPCKDAARKRHRERYKQHILSDPAAYDAHQERKRKSHLKHYTRRSYGLSIDVLEEMFAASNGKCAICPDIPDKGLVIDHCHTSGNVRGLLCTHCNSLLGFARDNIETLHSAIEYLSQSQKQ